MASRRRRICKENTPRIPPPSRVKIRFMPAKSVSLGRDLSRNLQQRYRRARTQQDLGVTATAASTPLLLSPECDAEAGALARWAAEVLEEATPATCRRFVRQRTEVVPGRRKARGNPPISGAGVDPNGPPERRGAVGETEEERGSG